MKSRVDHVVSSARSYFVQWKNAQLSNSIALFPDDNDKDGVTNWVKSQENIIKVSVDATTFSEQEAHGVGVVARSSVGELIHAQTWRYLSTNTADFC